MEPISVMDYNYDIDARDLNLDIYSVVSTYKPSLKQEAIPVSRAKKELQISDDEEDFYGDQEDDNVAPTGNVLEKSRKIMDAAAISTEVSSEVEAASKIAAMEEKLIFLRITKEKTEKMDTFLQNIQRVMKMLSPKERAYILFELVYLKIFSPLKYKANNKARTTFEKIPAIQEIISIANDNDPAIYPDAYGIVKHYISMCKVSAPGDLAIARFCDFIEYLHRNDIQCCVYELKQSVSQIKVSKETTTFLMNNAGRNYAECFSKNVLDKYLFGNQVEVAKKPVTKPAAKSKTRVDSEDSEDDISDDEFGHFMDKYDDMR